MRDLDPNGGEPGTLFLLRPRGFCAGVIRAIETSRVALETLGRPLTPGHSIGEQPPAGVTA
jgi:hypothetical protein